MFRSLSRLSLILLLPLGLSACEQVKSANPLSPQVAGPIAGISIEPPTLVAPASGSKLQDKDQPLSLVMDNPATNSPRPLTISVQVAVDTGFTNIVWSRSGIVPGDGRTSVPIDKLPTGRVYYWRVRGDDGAEVSEWTAPVYFEVQTPIVIGVPTPRSPLNDVRVANTTPELVVGNGASSGPFTPLRYQFQVSETQSFSVIFINSDVPEGGGGETHFTGVTFLTSWDKQYFWRARIFDATNIGNWSSTGTFKSPLAPVITVPPPAGGGGGGGTGPISGDWQSCASLAGDKGALVNCVHAAVQPGHSADRAFEVTKRVAWLLRNEGVGLLIKNGGENVIIWQGKSFSLSRVCYPDGHIFKVLSDAGEGGTNGPTWSDNDFVDKSLYVPAIQP